MPNHLGSCFAPQNLVVLELPLTLCSCFLGTSLVVTLEKAKRQWQPGPCPPVSPTRSTVTATTVLLLSYTSFVFPSLHLFIFGFSLRSHLLLLSLILRGGSGDGAKTGLHDCANGSSRILPQHQKKREERRRIERRSSVASEVHFYVTSLATQLQLGAATCLPCV